jgi:hypothetical protein
MIDVLSSPTFWQALGFTTACGIMISPIYYNGDYGKPIRAVIVLLVCGFFSLMICATVNYLNWKECGILSMIIDLCFILGLYIGVFLYNARVFKDKHN